MDQEPAYPIDDPAADDPEIAALLDFEPVPRRQHRENSWTPENQRIFIHELARTGDPGLAAAAVALTANGAYQLRRDPAGKDFLRAWKGATALFRRRNRPPWASPKPAAAPPPELEDEPFITRKDLDLEETEKQELLEGILALYLMKLKAERTARLDGRVIEADLCVRQLAFIEIVLAIGGRAQQLLEQMKQGDRHILQVVATPASNLLEKARRAFWLEKGEADRPPPAPLGRHNEFYATGEPTEYNAARDGDFGAWEQRQAEKRRLAAEAQREWEDRARRETGPDNDNDNDEADAPDPAA